MSFANANSISEAALVKSSYFTFFCITKERNSSNTQFQPGDSIQKPPRLRPSAVEAVSANERRTFIGRFNSMLLAFLLSSSTAETLCTRASRIKTGKWKKCVYMDSVYMYALRVELSWMAGAAIVPPLFRYRLRVDSHSISDSKHQPSKPEAKFRSYVQ